MRDLPPGTMVRCSKARAMFAMRACRKSIMVGKALDAKQMTAVRPKYSIDDERFADRFGSAGRMAGRAAHGHHGAAVELPARAADYAALVGSHGFRAVGRGAQDGLGGV